MGSCVVCGMPGYSLSAEHENAELCFKHYKFWLKSDKKVKVEELK